eukprot:Sspe_Gene.46725::Locus_23439_Transcript_1_1_Confidence_1.000_Length_413::g.46725::m.46725
MRKHGELGQEKGSAYSEQAVVLWAAFCLVQGTENKTINEKRKTSLEERGGGRRGEEGERVLEERKEGSDNIFSFSRQGWETGRERERGGSVTSSPGSVISTENRIQE